MCRAAYIALSQAVEILSSGFCAIGRAYSGLTYSFMTDSLTFFGMLVSHKLSLVVLRVGACLERLTYSLPHADRRQGGSEHQI